jgi:hypothetical protein
VIEEESLSQMAVCHRKPEVVLDDETVLNRIWSGDRWAIDGLFIFLRPLDGLHKIYGI